MIFQGAQKDNFRNQFSDNQILSHKDDEKISFNQAHEETEDKQEKPKYQQPLKISNFIILFEILLIIFVSIFLWASTSTVSKIKNSPYLRETLQTSEVKQKDEKQKFNEENSLEIKLASGAFKKLDYLKPKIIHEKKREISKEIKKDVIDTSDSSKMERILEQMMKGQYSNELNYAIKLLQNPQNSDYLKAEYYYYENKYHIGSYSSELPLCLISAGRNMMRNDKYIQFLKSIERQNYTNYEVVIVDDFSTDNSVFEFQKIISNSSQLKDRTTLLKNMQNIGALGNKDFSIRNFCSEDSIIVDIDADDFLVGKQVFNVINALYQSTQNWFMYSSQFFKRPGSTEYKQKGELVSNQDFQKNQYRTSKSWVTTELRTYLKKFYLKIPLNYLMQSEGKYHFWASDRFLMYSMTELAGKQHMAHIPHLFYYYNENARRSECEMSKIILIEMKSRFYTPLLPLQSLEEKAKITQNYEIPKRIITMNQKWKRIDEKCKYEAK